MNKTSRPRTLPDRAPRRAEAFTIIEMLVVVGIVGVIVAILLPAIGGVRRSAGNSKTLSMITDLTQASQQFLTDNRRLPGYFTVEEMGSPANGRQGFPMMMNVLLELSGGFVEPGETVPGGLESVERVGPGSGGDGITVVPSRIGADEGVGAAKSLYFAPEPNALKVQEENGQMAAMPQHKDLPHLVDAFGTPLLAWVESDTIAADAEFAAEDSGTPAKFYWTTNSAFLNRGATLVGRKAVDQTVESLLGSGRSAVERVVTMTALLGHPSYPDSQTPPEPASSRGSIVFHSAGANGVYLGQSEQAAKVAGGRSITYTGKDDPIRRSDDVVRSLGQ